MFPEGYAYIQQCYRCDATVIIAYVYGFKWKIDPLSIPVKDALVLKRYIEPVLNIWPDGPTTFGLNNEGSPVRFHATVWAIDSKPSRGGLFIRHICRIRRRKGSRM